MTPAWYALMTASSAGFVEGRRAFGEFAAVERIGDEGFIAWCPTQRILVRTSRHAAKRRPKYIPVLPGYCFARFDDGVPGARIERWREVIDVVRMGDKPYVLKPAEVAVLESLDETDTTLDASGKPERDTAGKVPRVGDQVEHRGNAWAGITAEVVAIDRHHVATVSMQFLGTPRRLQVRLAELEVVGRAKA